MGYTELDFSLDERSGIYSKIYIQRERALKTDNSDWNIPETQECQMQLQPIGEIKSVAVFH